MNLLRRHILALTALSLAAIAVTSAPSHAQEKVTVFAAASLKNALDAANVAWSAKSAKEATVSYAASSALAKQIEAGAPADVFISADLDWMNYVQERKLIVDDSRSDFLGNRIVLVATKGPDAKPVDIVPDFPLAKMLGDERLAMGEVNSVPAGKYGKAALEKLGIWDSVKDKVAGADSVRAALALVSQGEAPLGIVYQTDATADDGVVTIGTFPADSHPPIIYPIAITADSKNPDAKTYVEFLTSPEAAPHFEAQGFTVLTAR